MKHSIVLPVLFLALVSCTQPNIKYFDTNWGRPIVIDPSVPPDGEQLIQILLEHRAVPLKGTECERSGSSMGEDRRILQHRLAMLLGFGIGSPNSQMVLSSRCTTEPVELPDGDMPEPSPSSTQIDAWMCTLAVVDNAAKEVFIGGNIRIIFTKDTWKIFPKRLYCS